MKFTRTPIEPLRKKVPVEYYRGILENFKYRDHSNRPLLSGWVVIDGDRRQVKFGVRDGEVSSIEICEIKQGDTFLGVPMKTTSKDFSQLLSKAEIDHDIDVAGIQLKDSPIGFYDEDGLVASIAWS